MSGQVIKKVAGILALILAALILLPFLITILGGSASAAVSKAELDKLKAKAADLAKESKGLAAELKRVKDSKASAIKQKNIIDQQITVLEQEIETSNLILQNLLEQITQKEIEIAEAEAREAEEFELFKKRLRAMEECGTASYWGVLLKAESFSELLCNVDMITEIIRFDRELMARLKAEREAIEEAKEELETSKSDQEATKANLEAQIADLKARYEEQNIHIKELEKAEEECTEEYEAMLKEMERVNQEVKKMAAELAKQSKYVGGEYLWPTPGYYTITSHYGNRYHPITKKYSLHTGVDIGAPSGAKVLAANAGTVIISGWNSAYGNYIVINHGGGQTTLYGHLSKRYVEKGATVKRGDTIGLVGSTGWSTGPHLHFEISINGNPKNPMNYFKDK
jgi:murein DD-endopeptidase MepM/ murein hydrolase activator NlpD